MDRVRRPYPSDVDDLQWQHISSLFPRASRRGRRRTTDLREIWNAIAYLNRSGCAWRYLPHEFPPWQTVYGYFRLWSDAGILRIIHDFMVFQTRLLANRAPEPSILIIDCQSAKAARGEDRGYDGFKKVQGRKRTIFTDTLGLIHSVHVGSAQRGDHVPAIKMLDPESRYFPLRTPRPLTALYADAGYRGRIFFDLVEKHFRVLPTTKVSKHKVVCERHAPADWRYRSVMLVSNLKPVRWRVERTFAWFSYSRRLNRDYEIKTSASESMIHVAMTSLMLKRLQINPSTYSRWN